VKLWFRCNRWYMVLKISFGFRNFQNLWSKKSGQTNLETTTTVLWPPGLCPGLPGWAGTRKVKPVWIYWSKRVSGSGIIGYMQICTLPQRDSDASIPPLSFLQAGCPSCCPINRVKALKAFGQIYKTALKWSVCECVSVWMHLFMFIPCSLYTGCGKSGNVTFVGWQVTLCDSIWHVNFCSGKASLLLAIIDWSLHLVQWEWSGCMSLTCFSVFFSLGP